MHRRALRSVSICCLFLLSLFARPDRRFQQNAEFLALRAHDQQGFMRGCDMEYPLCRELRSAEYLFAQSFAERESRARSWANVNIRAAGTCGCIVFYPFGGPDATYPRALFQDCNDFMLAGLEPAGGAMLFADLRHPHRARLVRRTRAALKSLLERGYFVTAALKRDTAPENLGGVLPLLVAQLARSDAQILRIEAVAFGASGDVERAALRADGSAQAVVVTYHEVGEEGRHRRLWYFQQDLRNTIWRETRLAAWLSRQKRILGFFKAASYLPHSADFSELTEFILQRSAEILQDDTGIAFGRFAGSIWHRSAYGTYGYLLPEFREFFQGGIRDELGPFAPLPFSIGYAAPRGEGLMLYFRRR